MKKSYPQSERYCRDVVYRRAKNFSIALRFLPSEKRKALYALYAFARLADDIVDGDNLSLDLQTLQNDLKRVYETSSRDSYSWHASLGWAIKSYQFPFELFEELLKGMAMDIHPKTYQTWFETELYCYRAASTIGLLCLEVFGYTHPNARSLARDLGIAMQLTNILRDLREDDRRGRQYLPQEDYEDFHLTHKQLMEGRSHEARSFILFQVDRAQTYFERSQQLPSFVDKSARFCPQSLGLIYKEYLKQMRKNPFICLTGRLKIPRFKKLWITCKSHWVR